MSDEIDDFFANDGPQRDRWGRPLLLPRGELERKPYTRSSSLSDYLADFSHIWKWKMRYLARGLGQHRDLALLAGAESYTTGFDKGDEKENRASGRRLDDIIERVLDRAGISEKADYGTTVHAVTEPGDDNHRVDWDQRVRRDRLSYEEKLAELGIATIGTELFTANDGLMVSGTFDHLCYVPGYGICICDKKTSKELHPEDFRIQLATYANADLYDWETDERTTLEDFVESRGWNPALLNRGVGFIFWIKDGVTKVVRLDLKAGLEAAQHAAWVRDNHRKGKHGWPAEGDIESALEVERMEVMTEIESAKSVERLNELWRDYPEVRACWTPDHTAAAKRRKTEIEEAA